MKVDTTMSPAAAQIAEKAIELANAAQGSGTVKVAGETQGAGFAGKVREAVGSLVETGHNVDQSVTTLLSGGETDLHGVMVQMGKADLELRFMVQLRNRAIAAYDEVMRLQV
jgi:flagellar hook-basal body complex protein FliE